MTNTTRRIRSISKPSQPASPPLIDFASRPATEAAGNLQAPQLTLTFFSNSNGVPVANLHLGERQLLATTHPATIVAAIFVMGMTELTVVTADGRHTGELDFAGPGDNLLPIPVPNALMQLDPHLYQFRHLSPAASYFLLLEGLDLFANENWYEPTELADEHLRAAHHHLPKDLVRRPLVTAAPKGWKKTLARRNRWIYFPFC